MKLDMLTPEEREQQMEKLKELMKDVKATVVEIPTEERVVEIIVDAMDDIEARMNMCNKTDNDYLRNLAEGIKILSEAYATVKRANYGSDHERTDKHI